ncbi:MAG: cytochrome c oxidase assembly factor Coa1 family protein [Pseudomonadota bacterium]
MADSAHDDPIPAELDRWNWGAFFLTWIWGLGNKVWIALFALIPGMNFILMIVLGLRGSQMAWRAGNWRDEADFRYTQKVWAWVGAGLWAFMLVFGLGIFVLVGSITKNSEAYRMGMAALEDSPGVAEVFGTPLEAGWFVAGSISTKSDAGGRSGEASLSIPISGPLASGDAKVEAVLVRGEWRLEAVIAIPDQGPTIVVHGISQ